VALSPSDGARNPNLPVQPGPVPLTVKVKTIRSQPVNLIAVEVYGPTGLSVFFFDPDSADKVARMITTEALAARSNLHLPPTGIAHP
jgi:hypothetical protein